MTKEKVNEFTLRISQANRSAIIVILYEMAIQYLDDAALDCKSDHAAFRTDCLNAEKVIRDLRSSLDVENELGKTLWNFYMYISGQLQMAVIRNSIEEVTTCRKFLAEMKESFEKVALQDSSKPLMHNTEAVYTGLTYGRKAVFDLLTTEVKRGYTV